MPLHRTVSHHARTTTDGSERTDTARGIGAPRPEAKAPVACGTLHDDRAGTCRALGVGGAVAAPLHRKGA
ncbi:hypothetical protein ACIBJF_29410 [Streptomyces sp. NPDC050743]|uniref:hypothetical protein n=1 Tax=Streptomyces sp. NPDC050743 TaxID=3365634 RepID=UPI0037B71A8B